jgi:hypothetical protein
MVKKIDIKQNTKVKQKQNVNVRVNIDQRDTKKKPRKRRSNIPSAKREGVSSFSTGFTPVYIQSGNPYPIPSIPDATPIKASVEQQKVSSLVNPPVTSTTNLVEEVKKNIFTPKRVPKLTIHSIDSRSISPISFEDLGSINSSSSSFAKRTTIPLSEGSIGGRKYNKDDNSEIFSRDVRPITIRNPRRTRNEMNEAESMSENDTLKSIKNKK